MKRKIVVLDYGHGGYDSGAVYNGRKESTDNLKVGKIIREHLLKEKIVVVETRTGNSFVSLSERVKKSNFVRADYFISIHRNAFIPEKAKGIEAFVHPNSKYSTEVLGSSILKELSKLGFRNRGVKKKSFYVLKHTKAAAILLELGFIDNSLDNEMFDNYINEIGKIISQEIIRKAK